MDVDFNEFYVNLDQENRESRGSISYTDYYSNEDGQIRKVTQMGQANANGSTQIKHVCNDELPIDNIDDDEDHTLTLKQSEEQKKQSVKSIFEQKNNVNPTKAISGKKIGR